MPIRSSLLRSCRIGLITGRGAHYRGQKPHVKTIFQQSIDPAQDSWKIQYRRKFQCAANLAQTSVWQPRDSAIRRSEGLAGDSCSPPARAEIDLCQTILSL